MKILPQRVTTVGNGAYTKKNGLDYNFLGESKYHRTVKLHYWFNSYDNFAEKSEVFLLDKVVKLVGGGSVINGAYPV